LESFSKNPGLFFQQNDIHFQSFTKIFKLSFSMKPVLILLALTLKIKFDG